MNLESYMDLIQVADMALSNPITFMNTNTNSVGVFNTIHIANIKIKYIMQVPGKLIKGGITDLFVSLEAIEDFRAHNNSLFNNSLPEKYGIKLRPTGDLGICSNDVMGFPYAVQEYYLSHGGSLPRGHREIILGAEYINGILMGAIAGSF